IRLVGVERKAIIIALAGLAKLMSFSLTAQIRLESISTVASLTLSLEMESSSATSEPPTSVLRTRRKWLSSSVAIAFVLSTLWVTIVLATFSFGAVIRRSPKIGTSFNPIITTGVAGPAVTID